MLLYRVLYNTCSTQESTQLNTCDSGVVGNARPCQGRDRGFEPRLSLSIESLVNLVFTRFFLCLALARFG